MCRILLVRAAQAVDVYSELKPFAALARDSREYQGHGWGCSWLDGNDNWRHYHHIQPVWDDDLSQFSKTRLLLVHARSAFRDEGIVVENNMPFTDGETVFVFNGELRGVRIKSEGRIGAEKIYNYYRRLDKGDRLAALKKSVDIIVKRTNYIRAMNMIIADKHQQLISTTYNEDPEYFQMVSQDCEGVQRVCSEPYVNTSGWRPIPNNTSFALQQFTD